MDLNSYSTMDDTELFNDEVSKDDEEAGSADASFADVEVQKVFSTNRGRTYFGPAGMELGEHNWMLNFTMKIKDRIVGLKGKSASGLICVLKQKDYPDEPQEVFLRNTSWSNRKMLVADLQSGCTTAPTFVVNLSSNDLQKYGDWLMQKFMGDCQRTGRPTKKQVIKHIGLQDDGKTWYFNMDLVIRTETDGASVVVADFCPYITVKNLPSPCNVRMSAEGKRRGLMRAYHDVLPEDTFHAFVLMCGHNYLSFHHFDLAILPHLHTPVLVPFGQTGTGKTTMSKASLCYYGEGMDDICSMENATEAGLAKRWTEFHLPIILHDCNNPDLAAAVVECCFERSLSINFRQIQGVRPTSSVMLTMNNEMVSQVLSATKTKMKTASRVILLPMETGFPHFDAATISRIDKYRKRSSIYLPRLLNWNSNHCATFVGMADAVYETIRPVVENAGITESSGRISESYALLWAGAITFLDAVKDTVVDRFALRTFLERTVQRCAQFQTPDAVTRDRGCVAVGPEAAMIKVAFVDAVKALRDNATRPEIAALLREHCTTNNSDHFAVRLQHFIQLLNQRNISCDTKRLENLKFLKGSNARSYVRMPDGNRVWCVTIPRTAFTDAELYHLDGHGSALPGTDAVQPLHCASPKPAQGPLEATGQSKVPAHSERQHEPRRTKRAKGAGKAVVQKINDSTTLEVDMSTASNPEATLQSLKRKTVADSGLCTTSAVAVSCAVPTCKKVLSESQQNLTWIRCTECQLPFHLQCANVSRIALGTRHGSLSRASKCKYCSAKSRENKKRKG